MQARPLISVVTSIYNQAPYLAAAIESVLDQTYESFEFILIDDGSTDESLKIIKTFSDPRIRLVENEGNQGLCRSLNRGFSLARGSYILRFDPDDLCLSNRFEEQVRFMETHSEVDLAGSWVRYLGRRLPYVAKPKQDVEWNRCLTLFVPPVFHPSVILRASRVKELRLQFDPEAKHAEDYDLWLRKSMDLRISNVPKVLLKYRFHPNQVTSSKLDKSDEAVQRTQGRFFNEHGLNPTEEEIQTHFHLSTCRFQFEEGMPQRFEAWVKKLLSWNREEEVYPKGTFHSVLVDRWVRAASRFPIKARFGLRDILKADLANDSNLSWSRHFKYYALRGQALFHHLSGRP